MVIEWNKYKIFKSDEEWNYAKDRLNDNIAKLEGMLDTFDNDPKSFKEFTELKILVYKSIEEVYCYPRRFIDIDINDLAHKEMFNQALEIYNRIVALTNKYEELIKLDQDKICEYLTHPDLSYYKRYYEIVFNRLNHISINESEYFKRYQDIRDIYQDILANKLDYKEIQINGENVVINDENYSKYIVDDDQRVRECVYGAYMDTLIDKEDEILSLYQDKLNNDIKNALDKRYNSLKEMKLLEMELPANIIDNTIRSINKHLPVMHSYVEFRKSLSGLDEYHIYDKSYDPVSSTLNNVDYEGAFKLVRDSLACLGDEYLDYIDSIYAGGSIDLFPKKGKRTVSYTSITYAGIPYTCLNYKGYIDDVRTIAHEIGHAVHLLFSKNNNNFEYFEFSLFITEVVAKVNERLFYQYFLDICDNNVDKLTVLASYISSLANSLFNQVMFTEFEDAIVNKLSKKEKLKVEDANKLYQDLLVKYNGESLSLNDNDQYGWLTIKHYLLQEPFYLYQYSIGTSLANIIYSRLISDDSFKDKYINFLKVGNTMSISDSLNLLGIDLCDESIFDDSINLMKNLMNEYKVLSKKA